MEINRATHPDTEYHGAMLYAELAPKWKGSFYSSVRNGNKVTLQRDGTTETMSLEVFEHLTNALVESGVSVNEWWQVRQKCRAYSDNTLLPAEGYSK
jgi:hypothetical protein